MLVKSNTLFFKKCKNYLDLRIKREYTLHMVWVKDSNVAQLTYSFYGDTEDCKYCRKVYVTYKQLQEDWKFSSKKI